LACEFLRTKKYMMHKKRERDGDRDVYGKKGILEKEKCALGCYKVSILGQNLNPTRSCILGMRE
jgi:hypothetical protein